MVKKAINPTDKLDKVYLDATPLTPARVNELAAIILAIATGGDHCHMYHTDTGISDDGAEIILEAQNAGGSDYSIGVRTYSPGETNHRYFFVRANDVTGYTAGHWYEVTSGSPVELSDEQECILNAPTAGRTVDCYDQPITLAQNQNFVDVIYIKGDDPSTEEDFKHYVDRIKKFITRMEGKKISEQ